MPAGQPYGFYRRIRHKNCHADQWISAEKPTVEESKLLGKKSGSPVLVICHKTKVESDAVLDYSRTIYRADSYQYFVSLKRYPTVLL